MYLYFFKQVHSVIVGVTLFTTASGLIRLMHLIKLKAWDYEYNHYGYPRLFYDVMVTTHYATCKYNLINDHDHIRYWNDYIY